jgi:hypothetical protein
MVDGSLCSVLAVLGLSLIESRPLGWVPFRGSLLMGQIMPSTPNSYFLVALSPVGDLLLCAKHLFIAAMAA